MIGAGIEAALWIAGIVVVWVLVNKFLLPKLGIPT